MNIAVVGLGLIGASICKAVKAYTNNTVYGYDKNAEVCSLARTQNVIDFELCADSLKQTDMLFIALYPKDTIEYIENNYKHFKNRIIVCDLCGVKGVVCEYAFKKALEQNFTFIGCHPMAGKEFSGFAYSEADLFKGASMIITPPEKIDKNKLDLLEEFILKLGFASIKRSNPYEHDKIIACTSQLAHVVSSAYVKSSTAAGFKGFSAGSFADMTRVAKLNEIMWTELFFENKQNLICEIEELISNLAQYRDALAENDYEGCKRLLRHGRKIKEKFSNEEALH